MSLSMSTDNWKTDETSMKLQQLHGTRAMNKRKLGMYKYKPNLHYL